MEVVFNGMETSKTQLQCTFFRRFLISNRNTKLGCIDNHIIGIDAIVAFGGGMDFKKKQVLRDLKKVEYSFEEISLLYCVVLCRSVCLRKILWRSWKKMVCYWKLGMRSIWRRSWIESTWTNRRFLVLKHSNKILKKKSFFVTLFVAASEAGYNVVYSTFGKKQFQQDLQEFVDFISSNKVTTSM